MLDVELGALLAVALEAALVRFDGGLGGRSRRRSTSSSRSWPRSRGPLAGILVVVWSCALEAALRLRDASSEPTLSGFATHACFVGAFALLNLALLRAEVARIRATARARVEAQLVRIKEDARSYRLLGAGEAAATATRCAATASRARAWRRSTSRCTTRSTSCAARSTCTPRCSSG